MKLLLVQHGEAVAAATDPRRPLSDVGRQNVADVAKALAAAGIRATRVVDSGKTRARQTAEILADAIAPDVAVETVASGLAPKDPTDWLVGAAAEWTEDSLVVGHQPFMSRAVSRLVADREKAEVVAFTPGTVVCLERDDETRAWTIAWMLTPALVRQPMPL